MYQLSDILLKTGVNIKYKKYWEKMDPKVYEVQEGEKLWARSFDLLRSVDPDHEEYTKQADQMI